MVEFILGEAGEKNYLKSLLNIGNEKVTLRIVKASKRRQTDVERSRIFEAFHIFRAQNFFSFGRCRPSTH